MLEKKWGEKRGQGGGGAGCRGAGMPGGPHTSDQRKHVGPGREKPTRRAWESDGEGGLPVRGTGAGAGSGARGGKWAGGIGNSFGINPQTARNVPFSLHSAIGDIGILVFTGREGSQGFEVSEKGSAPWSSWAAASAVTPWEPSQRLGHRHPRKAIFIAAEQETSATLTAKGVRSVALERLLATDTLLAPPV